MYKSIEHQIMMGHYLGIDDNYQDQLYDGWVKDINVLKTNAVMYGFIGIDVANGYTISVIDAVKSLREKCPDATIVVGNVVTDMTELIL